MSYTYRHQLSSPSISVQQNDFGGGAGEGNLSNKGAVNFREGTKVGDDGKPI